VREADASRRTTAQRFVRSPLQVPGPRHERRRAVAAWAATLLAAGCAVAIAWRAAEPAARHSSEPLRLVRVASGLESPVGIVTAPDEPGRLYIVEQAGRVRVMTNGRLRREPFLDIRDLVKVGGEQGLLGLAFHPEYSANRRFYVHYTDVRGDTRLIEYRSRGLRTLDEAARPLLFVDQPYENHNGGQLAFGPDGLLYIGLGDGGHAFDPANRAQNLSSALGKLVRLDVDGPPTRWQVAAYGLRNPWRFSFDAATGDLYVPDVGQDRWEEVNLVPSAPRLVANFGWPVYEGRERISDEEPGRAGVLVSPVHVYGREDGCSVIGGYVYRGSRLPGLHGRYLFGDYCSGSVWSLRAGDGEPVDVRREPVSVRGLTSFGADARGELYLASQEGSIYRLAPG
jgi:glucose/arabinose dehydrogenase